MNCVTWPISTAPSLLLTRFMLLVSMVARVLV